MLMVCWKELVVDCMLTASKSKTCSRYKVLLNFRFLITASLIKHTVI